MNINPVIKFDIDCRVPARETQQRLEEITKKQSFFMLDLGHFHAGDKRRYIGRVREDRFSLRTRARKSLIGFFMHANRQIVISGKIEPRGPWCLVNVVIRPLIDVLITWTLATLTFLYLLYRVTSGYVEEFEWVALALSGMFLFVHIKTYVSVSSQERDYLQSLLGHLTVMPDVQSKSDVAKSWYSRIT